MTIKLDDSTRKEVVGGLKSFGSRFNEAAKLFSKKEDDKGAEVMMELFKDMHSLELDLVPPEES